MAGHRKEKIIKNISEFSNFKELFKLKKPKSPHSMVFLTEDPDKWFINALEYKTKSGIVVHNDFIIKADLANWIRWHKSLGWEEV